MPARELPLNGAPLAQGLEYQSYEPPANDAAKIPSNLVGTKPGHFNATNTGPSVPTPLEPVSIATTSEDAPSHGTNLPTDLHRDGWLDRSQPHVSTESQGRDLRRAPRTAVPK